MRKSKEETIKTKLKILQTAIKLFDERGFKETKLSHIAKEAKLSRGAVYWHFPSTEKIFLELLDNYLKPKVIQMNRLLEKDCSLLEAVEIFSKGLEKIISDSFHLHFMHLALTHKDEFPQGIKEQIKNYRQIWQNQIRQMLINLKGNGEIFFSNEDELEILLLRLTCFFSGLLKLYLNNEMNLSSKIGRKIIKSELLDLRNRDEKI